jgi:hypothetical protein
MRTAVSAPPSDTKRRWRQLRLSCTCFVPEAFIARAMADADAGPAGPVREAQRAARLLTTGPVGKRLDWRMQCNIGF